MTPRGIRNRNPGNIRASAATRGYVGFIGEDDAGFCRFDTDDNGLRAMCRLLLVYRDAYGLSSISGIVHRWAPPSENDSGAYVRTVAAEVGADPNAELPLHEPSALAALVAAMVRVENGAQPYSMASILSAARACLGMAPGDDEPAAPDAEPGSGPAETVPPAAIPAAGDAQPAPDGATYTGPAETPQRPDFAPDAGAHTKRGGVMAPVLALLQVLGGLLPAVGALFPADGRAAKNVAAAAAVGDAVVRAVAAVQPDSPPPNLQAAVETIASDATVRKAAERQLLADPVFVGLQEIGGGVVAARAAFAPTIDGRPWWTFLTSAPFWVALGLTPLLYLATVAVLMPNLIHEAPSSEQLKTLVVTAIFSGIAGAICGFFFGAAYTAQRTIRTGQPPA